MEITTTARRNFERCAIDIVGPTTDTNKGNKYILTFQNDLTKFVVAEPIQAQDADAVAREFVQSIILKFGTPEVVLSDQGSNFSVSYSETRVNYSGLRKLTLPRFTRSLIVARRGDTKSWWSTYDITWLGTG